MHEAMPKGKIDPQNASSIFTSFWLRAAFVVKFTSFDASAAKAKFTIIAKIKILNGFIFFLFIRLFALSNFNKFRAGHSAEFSRKK